jgi:hypothetical protein
MAMDQIQVVMAKRKPNWSESELFSLSDGVASNISIIRGQFGTGLTARDKIGVGPKLPKGKSFPREIQHDLNIIYPPLYPLF